MSGIKPTTFDPENALRAERGISNPEVASDTLLITDGITSVEAHTLKLHGFSVSEDPDDDRIALVALGAAGSDVRLLVNNSGADVGQYAVVVTDPSLDDAFTTTTSAQVTDQGIGVTQEPIADGATGVVLFGGLTPVQVSAAVTRGDFLETSTTAEAAGANATRRTGSFGVLLEGADPSVASVPGIEDLIIDTAVSTLGTAGTSFTFDMPATCPDGMIAILKLGRTVATAVTLAGWTLIGTVANEKWYWRETASEPATYTATWTTSSMALALIVILDGLDTASPVADSAFDATTAAAAIAGLSADAYLAFAGVDAVPVTPAGWTALAAGTVGTPGGTATIVQSTSAGANSGAIFSTDLGSAVTPGNLLVAMAFDHTLAGGTIVCSPQTGSSPRPFTGFGSGQATCPAGAYGPNLVRAFYRVATGDEQHMTWFPNHSGYHVELYEIADAGDPSGFEVRQLSNQAASTTKSLGAFGTPGALQLAGFFVKGTSAQTPGTGYTADINATTYVLSRHVAMRDTAGDMPQISGASVEWGGMAVGITSATSVVNGELVAQTFHGTGVTSPFTGASAQNDGILALSFLERPLIDVPLPLALVWPNADTSDSGSGSIDLQEDGVSRVNPATVINLRTGLAADASGNVDVDETELGTFLDLGAPGASVTIDLSTGTRFAILLTANCAITLSNPPASGIAPDFYLRTEQGSGGPWTISFTDTVLFRETDGTPTATVPALATAVGGIDTLWFSSTDGGAIYGAALDNGGSGDPALGGDLSGTASAASVDAVKGVVVTDAGTAGDVLTKTGALTATWATPDATFAVIGQEEVVSDGATTAWALDNDFEENSVSARNLTTGHVLSVTETLPNTATISAAGTAGDIIAFAYAATIG